MKIGILTFHRAHNYGALLQCFALKEYIESLGHHVSVIDYWPDYHANTYKLIPDFKSKTIEGKIKALLLFALGYTRLKKRAEGYSRFMIEFLKIEKNIKYRTASDLKSLEFDVVVYGSDQIWWKANLPGFKGFDWVYWGLQPEKVKKKITYAPSMGIMNYTDDEKIQIKQALNNFNAISLREKAANRLLKETMGIEAQLVLDPVFLVSKTRWEDICNSKPSSINKTEKYIFFYHLMKNEDACILAKKAAKYFGCRVIEIRGRVDALKFGNRYMQTVDPIAFIQLIRNAEFVISTSFHGTAFSILFEKQFIATGMGNNAERAKSLLNSIGLGNRYQNNTKTANFNEHIDYIQVNHLLDEYRKKSNNYLSVNLENNTLCSRNY